MEEIVSDKFSAEQDALADQGLVEYEVTRLCVGQPSHQVVRVSFELDVPGWCRLQRSKRWYRFLEVLGDLQKG